MREIIFLNGQFLKSQEARLPALAPGYLSGWGLFETMRAYRQRIIYFNQHLERIKDSCRLIQIKFPYSATKLKKIIQEAIKRGGFSDTYVRLTLGKSKDGSDILVIVKKYQPHPRVKYQQGFQACVSLLRQNENSLLSRIKTTSRIFYELAYQEAKKRGFDEALILNQRGLLTEASRSNIFLVKGNVLFTPDLKCGCLPGITRRAVFDLAGKYKIEISEGNFTPQDLYQADEAFLTNSLIGVMPLKEAEGKIVGQNKCPRLTMFFIKKYNSLLE